MFEIVTAQSISARILYLKINKKDIDFKIAGYYKDGMYFIQLITKT